MKIRSLEIYPDFVHGYWVARNDGLYFFAHQQDALDFYMLHVGWAQS